MRIEITYPFISTTVWGISIVGAKIVGENGFSPVEIVFGRFLLASILFIPILLYGIKTRKDFLPKSKIIWVYIIGLAMSGVAINNSIFYLGLEMTSASISSLLVSLNPLMTMIFGVLLLGEKMNSRKSISVILGILGVFLIVGIGDDKGSLYGNLLILLAVSIWGLSFSFSKKSSNSGLSSIAITGWSEIIGTLMLLPSILTTKSFPKYFDLEPTIIFWFVFMGLISSVIAYILHYKAVEVFGAGKIAPSTNIIPFSGALAAWLLLGESINIIAIGGFVLILIGVFIVHRD